MTPAVDLLYEAVAEKGHVCIGLDTAADYVPSRERRRAANDAEAVLAFNKALIDTSAEAAACFKVQIACYEEMGVAGLRAYSETLKYIRSKGCLVIADIKRGDIADTAQRYAKAHYSGDFEADFVTLNPYMGMDSIEPWLKEAKSRGKGAFVIMRTSNPGMKDFEYLDLANGKRLYHTVGEKISDLAGEHKGENGYGLFGIVVGCTQREEASFIRKTCGNLFFLVPGYGAQGGAAGDAALLLKDGNGGVVNASRSIITSWQKEENPDNADNAFAASCAYKAAVKMRDEILSEINN
ncbi:MAG: orotidine-5'-phosphate decarboxylase [Treponema sp.]|nr:orotidine-5'-phosphate decarboxylase [Treponema sp.]MCL2272336.1 orotidine-5'-phosphate decarboxylase [Treponema sp.]